jgi:PAS domain S-box-containing protein
MKRRRWLPLLWAGALFIGAVVSSAGYDIWRGYHAAVAATGKDLEARALVIGEQTARSVQAIDVVLRHLARQHRQGAFNGLDEAQVHALLREQSVGLVQSDGIALHDAAGRARALSWLHPVPVALADASGRAAFQRIRDDPVTDLVIGPTLPSRIDASVFFPMARRLTSTDGRFGGIVTARGRVAYFEAFYRDVQADPSARIALLHRDGTLLARHPPAPESLGKQFPVLNEMLAARSGGQPVPPRMVSPIDGRDRFGAVRVVPDYPLVVVVTRDAQAALAPWREQALGSGLRTLALALLAAVLLAVAVRQLKRLEAARASLEVSQERYALAAAGADDGIWDWDLAAGTAYESARARALQGLPPQRETQPLAELRGLLQVHPDDNPRREATMQAHLDGRTPAYEVDYRVRHADGQWRWIHVRALCIRDAEGRPHRIAGSVSDIDARKRAEEALRSSEERYQLAVDGSNEGLWDWDLPSDRLFLSPRAQLLIMASAGEPLRPRREWVDNIEYHPDDLPLVRRAIGGHLRGESTHFAIEYRVRHHSGQWHWYRQRGVALRTPEGKPYRMAGSMEDISERKRSEAERERLEQQLRQAQKLEAIGTLAGGIAHDFNNILAAILGYGEMAQKHAPEGSALRRHVDATVAAGQRAKSLVERILAFSRSGMGERKPVPVQAVVAEALDAVAESLPAGVVMERRLDGGAAAVLGDPTQIHQVMMNLCANAVHAMRGAGRLQVALDCRTVERPLTLTTSTLPPGRYLCLLVQDTGHGIAPELRERIFDPFFTTKEVGVGTGLGLSLVHGIVADLGGGIGVQSPPGPNGDQPASRGGSSGAAGPDLHEGCVGEGTAFSVWLPWRGEMQAAAAAAPEAHAPAGAGETVLLVDDEEALVRLGEELLAGLGYEPVGFTSPVAALQALRAQPGRFDCVLSDEAMAGLTGSELAAEAHALRPDLPIVLMSGFVTPGLLARAREAGVAEVLAKPLVERDIARALAAALAARRSEAPRAETA